MSNFDDELRGVLFPAREKKSERSPDFTGRCTIEGIDYRLAAWKKTSRDNKRYLSIAFTAQDEVEPGSDAVEGDELDF